MATTGALFPTVVVTAAESPWLDENWVAPGAVVSDNAVSATDTTNTANITAATYDTPDQSFVLKATGFAFSGIPDGSTINGVTCRIQAWNTAGLLGSIDLVQLLNAAKVRVGTNKAATPQPLNTTTTTVWTFGGSADVWGNALDSTWVKSAGFGVGLGIAATTANADVYVDYITLEVTYTLPVSNPPPVFVMGPRVAA